MTLLQAAIIVSLSVTVILALSYNYLYRIYREKYLALWTWSWAILSIRLGLLLFIATTGLFTNLLMTGAQLVTLASGILLLMGTYSFIGRYMSRAWLYFIIANVAWIVAAGSVQAPEFYISLPTYLFIAFAYIWTGSSLYTTGLFDGKRRYIIGTAFILLGATTGLTPFLLPIVWFEPWTYYFSTLFGLVIAINIILLYFRKNLNDLTESEEKYRDLVENANSIIIRWDPCGIITYCNDYGLEYSGFTREELIGVSAFETVMPNLESTGRDLELMLQAIVANPDAFAQSENESVRKNGERVWISWTNKPVFDDDGNLVEILSVGNDITKSKQSEKGLAASEKNFRELVESINSVILRWTSDGTITYLNDYGLQLFGYTKDEIIDRNVVGSIVPETESSGRDLELMIQGIIEEPEKYKLNENENISKNGDRIWISWTNRAIYDHNGGLVEILSVGSDITEHKRAEIELAESEKKYRELIEVINELIYATDTDGVFIYISPYVERLTGWGVSELTGKPFDIIIHKDDRELVRSYFNDHLAGKTYPVEFRVFTKTGETKWVRSISHPVYEGDRVVELRGVVADITDYMQAREEREKASKLESIGILAGGIAHDFNNVLLSVLGNISLAQSMLDGDEKTHAVLNDAETATNQAKHLASQLLTFSKGGAPVKQTADLIELINESTRFTLHGSNVKCKRTITGGLHPVDIDTSQINQVLHNLLINALQAMPDGGIIEINAENTTIAPVSTMPLDEGEYVKISVADQGGGIDPEILTKVFDPYFSTKKQGTGLGLSLAYSIIHQHGGHITAASETDSGAVFTIYLPASAETPQVTSPSEADRKSTATGRILVMDDEKSVLKIISRMLAVIGHEVVCAEDGLEAVELYKSALENGRRFDIVIMDLTIPGGMGGEEALELILKADPTVCAVVSSGYSNDPIVAEYEKYGFSGNISKPYSMATLKELLTNLLSK